MTVTLY